jgi:hypothetical protein
MVFGMVINEKRMSCMLANKLSVEWLIRSSDEMRSSMQYLYEHCNLLTLHCLELSHEDRDAIEEMDRDAGHSLDDFVAISHTATPGEEGFDISHEGGEHEVFDDVVASLTQLKG